MSHLRKESLEARIQESLENAIGFELPKSVCITFCSVVLILLAALTLQTVLILNKDRYLVDLGVNLALFLLTCVVIGLIAIFSNRDLLWLGFGFLLFLFTSASTLVHLVIIEDFAIVAKILLIGMTLNYTVFLFYDYKALWIFFLCLLNSALIISLQLISLYVKQLKEEIYLLEFTFNISLASIVYMLTNSTKKHKSSYHQAHAQTKALLLYTSELLNSPSTYIISYNSSIEPIYISKPCRQLLESLQIDKESQNSSSSLNRSNQIRMNTENEPKHSQPNEVLIRETQMSLVDKQDHFIKSLSQLNTTLYNSISRLFSTKDSNLDESTLGYFQYKEKQYRVNYQFQSISGERVLSVILSSIPLDKSEEVDQIEAKYKRKILSKIAHEFKTPLNNIISIADSICDLVEDYASKLSLDSTNREQSGNPVEQKYFGYLKFSFVSIYDKVFKVKSLSAYTIYQINDIINYANNYDFANMQFSNDMVDVENVALFCFEVLEALLYCYEGKQTVQPELFIEDGLDSDLISTNEVLIIHVILNLISNAVKFTKSGFIRLSFLYDSHEVLTKRKESESASIKKDKKVSIINLIHQRSQSTKTLSKRDRKKDIVIQVEDSGVGMSEEEIQRITEGFEANRIVMDLEEDYNSSTGSGLGLYVSNCIIKRLDYELKILRKKNSGACFQIKILKANSFRSSLGKIKRMKTKFVDNLSSLELHNAKSSKHSGVFLTDHLKRPSSSLLLNDSLLEHVKLVNSIGRKSQMFQKIRRNMTMMEQSFKRAKTNRTTSNALDSISELAELNDYKKNQTGSATRMNIYKKPSQLARLEEDESADSKDSVFRFSNDDAESNGTRMCNTMNIDNLRLLLMNDTHRSYDLDILRCTTTNQRTFLKDMLDKHTKESNALASKEGSASNKPDRLDDTSGLNISADGISKDKDKGNETALDEQEKLVERRPNYVNSISKTQNLGKKDHVASIDLEIRVKNKILIVDDSQVIRSSMRKNLMKVFEKNGLEDFTVVESYDGIQTLNYILEDQVSQLIRLIITDENMEYMCGSDSARIIKSLEKRKKIKSVPIISYTCFQDDSTKKTIHESGIQVILEKPVSLNKLEEIVLRLLDK